VLVSRLVGMTELIRGGLSEVAEIFCEVAFQF
jgi:hypothetical protein